MTLTIDLDSDVEARLKQAAICRGQSVAELLQDVVRRLPDDPTLLAIELAEQDDEPFTEAQQAAVADGLADIEAGRVLSHHGLRQRFSESARP